MIKSSLWQFFCSGATNYLGILSYRLQQGGMLSHSTVKVLKDDGNNIRWHNTLIYSQKYWRELNLAIGPQNRHCKSIGRFKFGSSVKDHHTSICKYEILEDFNLAVVKQTAKPSNLIPRQIFRLYGKSCNT